MTRVIECEICGGHYWTGEGHECIKRTNELASSPSQPVVQVGTEATAPQNHVRSGVPLLDCPFCGARLDTPMAYTFGKTEDGYRLVICNRCEASGPSGVSDKMSKQLWNKRAIQKTNNTAG